MTTPPAPDGSEPPVVHCYRHPNREARVRCVRCDRPICPDCMRPASVGFHCPDDVRSGARSVRAPRNSVGARLRHHPPVVTGALFLVNVAMYLVTGLQKPGTLRDPFGSAIFRDLVLQPYIVQAQDEFYRLVTADFLHLSPLHIAANMLSLLIIGPTLERFLGWWRFLAVYLVTGLGGSAVIYAFGDELSATAGASGAIFGLLGVCLVLVRKLGLDVQWLIGTLVLNFAITYSVPGISKEGHLGGFLTGVLAGVAIGGLPTMRGRLDRNVQLGGLGGLLALLVVVIAIRTATFS